MKIRTSHLNSEYKPKNCLNFHNNSKSDSKPSRFRKVVLKTSAHWMYQNETPDWTSKNKIITKPLHEMMVVITRAYHPSTNSRSLVLFIFIFNFNESCACPNPELEYSNGKKWSTQISDFRMKSQGELYGLFQMFLFLLCYCSSSSLNR